MLCEPIEIGILVHSCDVVQLGKLLKTVLIQFPSSVSVSSDSAKILQALLVKILKHVKLRSQPSLGRKQKNSALARCRCGQRAWRNKKPVLSLSALTDEEAHPLENEGDSG